MAWKNYIEYDRSPRKRRAGVGFSDPEFPLPIEWLEASKSVHQAEKHQKSPKSNSRILVINGSTRSNQTCPGEMSKTFRLAKIAEKVISGNKGFEVDFLDLSRLASEYGRIIYPCKACVSTDAFMPLALLLLSEPRYGTGQRLDGGNLSTLERGPWNNDPMTGALVPGAELAEAHDRSLGLRRRRKSGPDVDEGQESSTGQRSGA